MVGSEDCKEGKEKLNNQSVINQNRFRVGMDCIKTAER